MQKSENLPVVTQETTERATTTIPVGIRTITTVPDQLVAHWILDEQLEMLGESNRDGLSEAMWAFGGGAIAAATPAIAALWNAYFDPSHTMSPLDVIYVATVVVCAAVAVTIRIISGRRSVKAKTLIAQIRARQTLS